MKLLNILQIILYAILAIFITFMAIYTIVSAARFGFEAWMIPMAVLPVLGWFMVYCAIKDIP